MEISPFYKLKCLFVGQINCGKSSFCHLINHDEHCYDSEPTIGLAYSTTHIELQEYPLTCRLPQFYLDAKGIESENVSFENRGESKHFQFIKLQLWDCAGSMRYRSFLNSYMRNVDICFIFFDLTNRESFEEISKWHQEVIKNSQVDFLPKFLIIANKSDLKPYDISLQELQNLSNELKIPYVIFSCLDEEAPIKAKKIIYNQVKKFHEEMLVFLHSGRPVPDYITNEFHQPKKSNLIFLQDDPYYSHPQCCTIS
jgi:small GTP-binding protein